MSAKDMNPYDRKAWTEIEEWRTKRLDRAERHVMPERMRAGIARAKTSAKTRIDKLPGSESFEGLFMKALDGLFV